MNKSSIIIPKDLKDDIQKFGSNVAKEIAIHAREELTMAYAGAIEIFYRSYSPIEYVRQWALRDSYQKYYTNFERNVLIYSVLNLFYQKTEKNSI